jgi:3-hydroxyisobutyrate dehydrogenase-like beta-hydroxyacid dehydrogenase
MKVALIGLGEVGALITEDLAEHSQCSAFDIKFSDSASRPSNAAARNGLRAGADHADAAREAELVICAVTAAQTRAAAAATAPGLMRSAWYLDLNSASPDAKTDAATIVNNAGGRYVEAAVMSPFAPKRCASPILLGGPHAAAFEPIARQLGFGDVSPFGTEYGKVSAAKLCRSIIVKGIEALLLESLLSARHYAVEQTVLESLHDIFPGCDWPTLSRYMISRAIEHGIRRAEEMREACAAISGAGLTPVLAAATAERQEWAARHFPANEQAQLHALLDAMRSPNIAGNA